ncbi:MAG: DUF4340 domain-containing protein [Candidatus Dadabacteria bacterium]|nr:DUF4340 domain-containing protein [Candidatus Dadabacteria bacterium]
MSETKELRSYLIRFVGTVIGAGILIILIGYLYFFEIRKQGEEAKKGDVFPEVRAEQINELILKYPAYTVACLKEGGEWVVLKDSIKYKAEGKAIRDLVENFTNIRIERVASETPNDLAGFGLEKPKAEVIASTPENKYRILIGGDSPVGSGAYIKVDEDSRVLIASKSTISWFLKKSANDLRDKQILSLDEDKIKRLRFTWEDSSFEVERKGNTWIGKNIPEYVEIDGGRVWAILNTFLKLKIDNFENDEPQEHSRYGLDKPSAEIELFENGKSVRVLFGNKKRARDYYIKLGSAEPVYSVNEYVLRQVPENVNDIRVRRIVKLDAEKVTGVGISKGGNELSIIKKGNKWELEGEKGKRVDESKVGDLIAEIGGLEVEVFVDDNSSDLSSYGLDKPEIELTIMEVDKKKTVLFGRKEKEKVYVKLADRSSVYLLSGYILSQIPSSKDELIKK